MAVHLAGFVHGGCDYEGAIPVKLNIADFPPVTHQSVNTSGKKRKQEMSQLCMHACKVYMWNAHTVNDDTCTSHRCTNGHMHRHMYKWMHIVQQQWIFHLPEATSHITTVWSKEPVTSWLPTVSKHRDRISAVWPWMESSRVLSPTVSFSIFLIHPLILSLCFFS